MSTDDQDWIIDGIPDQAVARAERAAAAAGVPVSVWLARVIRQRLAREGSDPQEPDSGS